MNAQSLKGPSSTLPSHLLLLVVRANFAVGQGVSGCLQHHFFLQPVFCYMQLWRLYLTEKPLKCNIWSDRTWLAHGKMQTVEY